MFTRHAAIGSKLLGETKKKGIKLPDYFSEYVNLRNVFIQIYKTRKELLNPQKIEKRLRKKPIDEVIYHLEDMVDLLNMKFRARFVNNLDLVENMVKICKKLSEKEFVFTTKLLFQSAYDYGDKGKEGKSQETKKSGEEFEIL